jgi:hypothetical protein
MTVNRLTLTRVPLRAANAFVGREHRHHGPSRGHVFSLGATSGAELVGVAIAGRPVARGWDANTVLEVTRLATDGTRNACSFLYGAARRAGLALGWRTMITYALASEPGTSLRAAGFRRIRTVRGRAWSCRSRYRDPHAIEDKTLWAAGALLPEEIDRKGTLTMRNL